MIITLFEKLLIFLGEIYILQKILWRKKKPLGYSIFDMEFSSLINHLTYMSFTIALHLNMLSATFVTCEILSKNEIKHKNFKMKWFMTMVFFFLFFIFLFCEVGGLAIIYKMA